MNTLTRFITTIGHGLWRPVLRQRLGRVTLEKINDVTLVVLPEVFNPVVFRTGAFLAQTLTQSPELEPSGNTSTALDLGTGSGVGAIFAARRGYRVTAVDINPHAVRCARVNALIQGLEDRIDVFQGDLFEPVQDKKFDLVTFNPPYFRGTPSSPLDMAWRADTVLERFAADLPKMLKPGGKALLLLSTDGAKEDLLDSLKDNAMTIQTIAERRYGNEILSALIAEPALTAEPE